MYMSINIVYSQKENAVQFFFIDFDELDSNLRIPENLLSNLNEYSDLSLEQKSAVALAISNFINCLGEAMTK